MIYLRPTVCCCFGQINQRGKERQTAKHNDKRTDRQTQNYGKITRDRQMQRRRDTQWRRRKARQPNTTTKGQTDKHTDERRDRLTYWLTSHVINRDTYRSRLCSYSMLTHHHVINRSGLCSYHILTHQSRHQRVRSVQLQPTDSPVTPPTVTPTDPVCPATVAFSPFMSSRATAREPAEDRTLSVGTTASADTMTLPALKVSVTKAILSSTQS